MKTLGILATGLFLGFFATLLQAETMFLTSSKPMCSEVVKVAKGHISYEDSMKSGELGFHHCIHKKLYSTDFPQRDPEKPGCRQIDMNPEVVAINPPLPHEENEMLPVFGRPNPYHARKGEVCEVKYSQAYFRP
jgi:hypothetical protein